MRPFEGQRTRNDLSDERQGADGRYIGLRRGIALDDRRLLREPGQFLFRNRRENPVGGIGGPARPVAVETARYRVYDRPLGQNVEVDEQSLLPRSEIFVADIAAADDGHLAVGGETLVVHPPVQSQEIGEIAEHFRLSEHEGIEQPDLDVGMPVERREDGVEPGDAIVIQQHAHAHAAVGCLPHGLQHQCAGKIAVPDVILNIETACRRACKEDARGKSVAAVIEHMDAGQPRMAFRQRRSPTPERRIACIAQMPGYGPRFKRRQRIEQPNRKSRRQQTQQEAAKTLGEQQHRVFAP